MLRPEIWTALSRYREVILAAVVAALGLWLLRLGGLLLVPAGAALLALAAAWATMALRRLRFAQGVGAPGIVELDERQVGYLGPTFGGYVSLDELTELRLIRVQGQRMWRLKQTDGQALLVPVAAAGAERLFDAFATLPGMDTQALVAVLGEQAENLVVWRRGKGPAQLRLVKG